MCVTLRLWQANWPTTSTMKNILFTKCFCPFCFFSFLFLFFQSLWWTRRATVWHWWGEGIISMSKISSLCQSCQLLRTQTHNLAALTDVCVCTYVLSLFSAFFPPSLPNGPAQKEKSICDHMWCISLPPPSAAVRRHREMTALSCCGSVCTLTVFTHFVVVVVFNR